MEQCRYLFVYGSLLSGFKSPAYEYISKYFLLVGEATVAGTIYDMGSYPAAVPDDSGRLIRGELYELRHPSDFSYAMAQLDDYEGLYPDQGEAVDYERCLTKVTMQDGKNYGAWIYWYKHKVTDRPVIESGNMLEYMQSKGQ